MIRDDEDALICDFAETYHIHDYRSLPARLAATLAAGLGEESRIIRKYTEAKASTTNTILTIIADHLRTIRYMLGDEAEIPSVTAALYQLDPEEPVDRVKAYRSGDDFLSAWKAINED